MDLADSGNSKLTKKEQIFALDNRKKSRSLM